MSAAPPVLIDRTGAVMVITINRSHARNAIDHATSVALAAAFDQLDSDAALRAAVLTGAGEHFCSGMDLKAFLRGERIELPGRGLAGIVETPPAKPVIAAVEGYALAGGFEIALACDLIVASQTACFGLPEVCRGLIAGSGGLMRLPGRIPRQIALEYAMTGEVMPATEARQWGLISRLTEPGKARTVAVELAGRIAANAPLAVAASRQIINDSTDWPAAQRWSRQRELLERIITSRDAREGAQAFAEKRAPRWTGQ